MTFNFDPGIVLFMRTETYWVVGPNTVLAGPYYKFNEAYEAQKDFDCATMVWTPFNSEEVFVGQTVYV